jgi:sporulation protein YlmC with PRC-barrel domain
MKETITSDDILGKEAVDSEGEILGVVVKLHIDKTSKQLVGLTIDQGFMKPDLYVGINNIKQFGVDAVLLNRAPVDKFLGLHVITSEGYKVGVVKQVIKQGNSVKVLIIDKDKEIPFSSVKEIGASVVLKEGYKL